MERSHRSSLIVLISFLGSCNACYHTTRLVSYPTEDINHSIVLAISKDELDVPTGKCEDIRSEGRDNNRLSLIVPRTCTPRRLYPGFISSDSATCLSLRDSKIESVLCGSFDRLPNLCYLDLSKNRLKHNDLLSIGGHATLKTLIVDENGENMTNDNRGSRIDRADFFPRLRHLYLRKNFLRQLTISIARHFPNLAHLYLSDNLLTSESLKDFADLPTTLSHLHLERNQIGRVESRISRHVGYLFLDDNAIVGICSDDNNCSANCIDLRGATELWFLSLSRNEIAFISSDSFIDASNIRSLNLARNRIETIAIGTFESLKRLEDLSLSHNRLRTLPDFHRIVTLVSLAIDHNYIEAIFSRAFYDLRRLKWLSLRGNRLRTIEREAFRNLPTLEELDLSDNMLDHLAPSWIDCETPLRLLDLRDNRFVSYDHLYLRDLLSLVELYVQGNPLARSSGPSEINTYTRNLSVHAEYGVTYETRPCYVTCSLDNRFSQNYNYAI